MSRRGVGWKVLPTPPQGIRRCALALLDMQHIQVGGSTTRHTSHGFLLFLLSLYTKYHDRVRRGGDGDGGHTRVVTGGLILFAISPLLSVALPLPLALFARDLFLLVISTPETTRAAPHPREGRRAIPSSKE